MNVAGLDAAVMAEVSRHAETIVAENTRHAREIASILGDFKGDTGIAMPVLPVDGPLPDPPAWRQVNTASSGMTPRPSLGVIRTDSTRSTTP